MKRIFAGIISLVLAVVIAKAFNFDSWSAFVTGMILGIAGQTIADCL